MVEVNNSEDSGDFLYMSMSRSPGTKLRMGSGAPTQVSKIEPTSSSVPSYHSVADMLNNGGVPVYLEKSQSHTNGGAHSQPSIPSNSQVPTSGPSFEEHTTFGLYEQDNGQNYDYQYGNPSELRLNFEDMIILPKLSKNSTSDIPGSCNGSASTNLDCFDLADQHLYFSRLTETVNSTTAAEEYGTRRGPLWDSVWEMLVPKGLLPAYLTESEFVKLVLSQGNETSKWMDEMIPILNRRTLQKAAVARQKLSNAGISPLELTQEYLEAFEWMDKIEQDNFIRTLQSLQLQVSFHKAGLSLRMEDISNDAPIDEKASLFGTPKVKLRDGKCLRREDTGFESEASFMVDKMSAREFESQFTDDAVHKRSGSSDSGIGLMHDEKVPAPFSYQPAVSSVSTLHLVAKATPDSPSSIQGMISTQNSALASEASSVDNLTRQPSHIAFSTVPERCLASASSHRPEHVFSIDDSGSGSSGSSSVDNPTLGRAATLGRFSSINKRFGLRKKLSTVFGSMGKAAGKATATS